jgi:hypothetical protein
MSRPGDRETCDWCGRSGTIRQFESWSDDRLDYRDPALCAVCFFWWDAPAELIDAMAAEGIDYYSVMRPFESELARQFTTKLRSGARSLPSA